MITFFPISEHVSQFPPASSGHTQCLVRVTDDYPACKSQGCLQSSSCLNALRRLLGGFDALPETLLAGSLHELPPSISGCCLLSSAIASCHPKQRGP